MKVITSLEEIDKSESYAFTIGTFDGVHQGHKTLFNKLKETGSPTAIITFSTHPLQTLRPENPLLLITPLSIKLALLEAVQFDMAIVLPFSREIANLTFDQFLSFFSISHLIRGKGSTFGKDKQGTEANVRAWAAERGIFIDYIDKTKVAKETISSRSIRDAIKMGDLPLAEQLLGRPHLLSVPANTTRFSVSGLAMPPDGKYPLSQGIFATLSTLPQGRFIELSTSLPETTTLSFNPTRNYVI